jgi:hypothetical protein
MMEETNRPEYKPAFDPYKILDYILFNFPIMAIFAYYGKETSMEVGNDAIHVLSLLTSLSHCTLNNKILENNPSCQY